MAEDRSSRDDTSANPFKEIGIAEDWPEGTSNAAGKIFEYDLDELRGRNRLGDLAFNEVPDILMSIRATLDDLAYEHWGELPGGFADALTTKVEEICSKLDQIVELSATSENAANKRERFVNQLREMDDWLRKEGKPLAVEARVMRALENQSITGASQEEENLKEIKQEIARLRSLASKINQELDSRQEAVDQARADAGESAGEELGEVFNARANSHKATAERWLVALAVSGPLAVGFAILTFVWLRPDQGSHDAHDFAGVGLAIFILGILAFAIRICAQNYRVNRHLEAVAHSRASAIATFQRLAASASDPEIRSAVTLTLAQSIFATEDTGLTDGSGDHVTLVERAAVPLFTKSEA